jgi:hypothetical protein
MWHGGGHVAVVQCDSGRNAAMQRNGRHIVVMWHDGRCIMVMWHGVIADTWQMCGMVATTQCGMAAATQCVTVRSWCHVNSKSGLVFSCRSGWYC